MNTTIVDVTPLMLSAGQILARLLCAMVIGVVIGTEREYTHRPAGMRTHMLVALGACAVMITSQLIFAQYRQYGATPDPARLSAQVITGVGFLGAGTIMREGTSIKGLTTAASIWAVACLGVAIGAGYFAVGLLGMLCMMITLIVFEWLQKKLIHSRETLYNFSIITSDVMDILTHVNQAASDCEVSLTSMNVTQREDGNAVVSFKADFQGRRADERRAKFFTIMNDRENVLGVKSDRNRM